MRRYLLGLLSAAALLLPLAANSETAAEEVTKEDVYAAFDARDVDAMQALYGDVYARYLKGEVNADYLRLLFEPFGTNNPEFLEFTRAWLQKYPNSIHANVALTWIYNRTSWYIRGNKFAKQTYPDALREFRFFQEEAWNHALKAYELDNRYIVASDAIMRTANGSGKQLKAFEVLDEAMTLEPDMGTLRRALDMTDPGWGGSWEMAEAMCTYYGPMIQWKTTDPTLFCKVLAIGNAHWGGKNLEWALEMLKTHDLPALDYIRANWAKDTPYIWQEVEFLRDYLNREDVTNVHLAGEFDLFIAQSLTLNLWGKRMIGAPATTQLKP